MTTIYLPLEERTALLELRLILSANFSLKAVACHNLKITSFCDLCSPQLWILCIFSTHCFLNIKLVNVYSCAKLDAHPQNSSTDLYNLMNLNVSLMWKDI